MDDPGAWGYGIAASCCNVDPVDERQGAEQCGTDDRREEPPRRCQHPALQGCCRTGGLGLKPVAGRAQLDRRSDRKSVVEGKSVSVRVDLGGWREKKKTKMT